MEKFNLTSNENGRIIKNIQAENRTEAENKFLEMGYDLDDNFVESETETNEFNKKNINGRTIYIDEER